MVRQVSMGMHDVGRCTERVGTKHESRTDLEIHATAAHDAIDPLDAADGLDFGENRLECLLGFDERFLVVVGAPLAPPFAGDRVELHTFGDGTHGSADAAVGERRNRFE